MKYVISSLLRDPFGVVGSDLVVPWPRKLPASVWRSASSSQRAAPRFNSGPLVGDMLQNFHRGATCH